MADIRPLHSEEDYAHALVRIEALMDAKPGTPQGNELDILVTLVEAYEERNLPLEVPDALTAILFIMDQRGLTQKDFAALVGKSRASEILNRKRGLSLNQAKLLYREWGVPAEALLKDEPSHSAAAE
ncbi:MAG: transcriptional regulator [Alphaproteobacteria bacterium]|nr:MAG: transcriptional regulator [Alphaproteobacteria bacterium]